MIKDIPFCLAKYATLLLVVIGILGTTYTPAKAAESHYYYWERLTPRGDIWILNVDWTAAADGSFTEATINQKWKTAADANGPFFSMSGEVLCAIVNPGSTAPQADYDIVLKNSDGVKLFGTGLDACHTSSSEHFIPSQVPIYFHGPLTLDITNNNVNTALGHFKIYVRKHE